MFAHKITELSFNEKINEGVAFIHTSKISGEKFNYEIIGIELGKPKINDAILLQNLDNKDICFTVEPEWFNQRIKGINFIK